MSKVFNNYSPLTPQKELKWQTFLVAFFVAAAVFLPFIIADGGYFLFYGDYSVQQIPFYQMCHEAIREGSVSWDWGTDLGANFVGSYSFYLLGSPFFWLTIPFPTSAVPYLIAPLLVLKIALSALTSYLYIRRFTRTPNAAMLGGLLYAFSGFSVYNIFFNHFHEAIVFFPLLLWSIELLITENRRGPVAFSVFLCAASNYYFFFGMVIFITIYWLVRMLSHSWRFNFKRFLWLAFECILGVLMAAAILLTAIAELSGNTRLSEFLMGWDAILYGKEQIYANIIQIFFFPPDIPARPVFFPNAEVQWSSLGGWLPLLGMCGVFAWMQSKKGHWLRRIIGISIFMALVPILNSAFSLFNHAYYARWFYMPILLMCLCTVMAVEDKGVNWKTAYKWSAGITLAFVAVIGFFPSKDENGELKFGLFTEGDVYPERFAITCAIAVVALVLLGLLLTQMRTNRKFFINAAVCVVCIISLTYSSYFILTGRTHAYDIENVMIDSLIEGEVKLEGDKTQYRIDTFECVDNTGMFLGYDSINTFHSIVPQSIIDFYEFVGEERVVGSRPTTKSYPIRSLLSVKYLLARADGNSFEAANGSTLMPSYKYIGEQEGYKIYENECYIPYGFTYDYYMDYTQVDAFGEDYRANMLLKAILLEEGQIQKYSQYLKPLTEDYNLGVTNPNGEAVRFDNNTYQTDCERLSNNAVSSFTRTKNGFIAEIDLEKPNLVFFSVPFDEGWTATVNGEEVEIEKVNAGFMAVLADKGTCVIEFNYKTPGLSLGIKISIAAFIIFIIYASVFFVYKRKNPHKFLLDFPEGDRLCEKFSAYDIEEKIEVDEIEQVIEEIREEKVENAIENNDEIFADDDFFKEIDRTKSQEKTYRGFSGGFLIDETALDETDEDEE